MEKQAARIGLKPAEYWQMTLVELSLQIEGYAWRQEQEQWQAASIIAAIYEVNRDRKKRRKPITAETVMGRKRQSRKSAVTPEEQHDRLMEFMRRAGGRVKYRAGDRLPGE